MSESNLVAEATLANFDALVIDASHRTPVLVDFWADWCQPCQMLAPILDKLAAQYRGKLTVVKVNTDAEQDLAQQFGVRSLPTVKLFVGGEAVDEFMGVQPEGVIRNLLDRHVGRESDAARAEAAQLLDLGDPERAISVLEDADSADPENPRVKPDLLRALINTGHLEKAATLLSSVPMNLRMDEPYADLQVELRLRQQASETEGVDVPALQDAIAADPGNLDKRLKLAARLAIAGEHRDALEQYLEVMKRDRKFQDDAGRKGMVETFQLLGATDPLVVEYRRRMAAMLH